ncbi:MAG: RNA pseudouridine synthase [Oscillospiraceae bacterium]|nr:RNA pseudouridine synthase [Oscillospiraceae bacterium]
MEILFSDKDIAVCIKPVGLDSETEVPRALAEQLGGEVFPLHRLDKNVGGVMVYGRTKSAAAALSKVIQEGRMVKEYVAKLHGAPPEAGILTDLLFKDSRKNKVFVVKKARAGVKEAKLQYRHLGEGLVHVRLFTGRSHQIRVQFSSRGFPLVGDHKYGSRAPETAPMLFSCRITFPFKGQICRYAALPQWAETAVLEEWV